MGDPEKAKTYWYVIGIECFYSKIKLWMGTYV